LRGGLALATFWLLPHHTHRRANLLRAPTFAAFLAVIMLVIAGVPLRASAMPCTDCPPDCMIGMNADASAHADASKGHPAKAPADISCKAGMTCQTTVVPAVLPSGGELTPPMAARVALSDPPAALVASHPPDRTLRPPIIL
jgi:hypothetical protein